MHSAPLDEADRALGQQASDLADELLLSEVALPSARGRRSAGGALVAETLRGLTAEDLPALLAAPDVGARTPTVQELRQTHHFLAQTLAKGHTDTEASFITGYSVSRISILKQDPAFAALMQHYGTQKELALADVFERMRVLGLATLDELRQRLEDEPNEWTKRELMDLAKLLVIDGSHAKVAEKNGHNGGALGGSGVSVTVKFIAGAAQAEAAPETPGPLIDLKAS